MTDPTSLPNFPPPSDQHPLRGRVLDALQDEGYRPDIDGDGDVSFKVQGQQLFVRCMEGDFDIMRVFGQWQIGEDVPQDLFTQLRACNDLTLGLNVIKAGIASGTLVVTGEHVVGTGTDIKAMLQVTSQLILSAVQMWHQTILGGGLNAAEGSPDGVGPATGEPGAGPPDDSAIGATDDDASGGGASAGPTDSEPADREPGDREPGDREPGDATGGSGTLA